MATKKSNRAGRRKAASARKGGEAASDAAKGAGEKQVSIEGKADEVRQKKKTSPMEFARQVRAELSKVTWTTRNATFVSTIMVLIMVAIMAVFFFVVDQGLRIAVCNVLPIDCVARDAV